MRCFVLPVRHSNQRRQKCKGFLQDRRTSKENFYSKLLTNKCLGVIEPLLNECQIRLQSTRSFLAKFALLAICSACMGA